MSMVKYSGQLRALSEDYYCGQLSFEEYRKLRSEILGELENEMNMTAGAQSASQNNVLERVLAYFKSTEISEQ